MREVSKDRSAGVIIYREGAVGSKDLPKMEDMTENLN